MHQHQCHFAPNTEMTWALGATWTYMQGNTSPNKAVKETPRATLRRTWRQASWKDGAIGVWSRHPPFEYIHEFFSRKAEKQKQAFRGFVLCHLSTYS